MSFDPFNERYKDINAIYERNLGVWLWLWLPFLALGMLIRELIAKRRETQAKEDDSFS